MTSGYSASGDPPGSGRDNDDDVPKSQGQRAEMKKRWTKYQKQAIEIICGTTMFTSPKEELSIAEIVEKAGVQLKNLEPPGGNLALRLKNMMSDSLYLRQVQPAPSPNNSIWRFVSDRTNEFKEMVDKFVDEKPELAEAHGIEKFSPNSRSRKRRSYASTPAAISVTSATPKKRHRSHVFIKSSTSVLGKEKKRAHSVKPSRLDSKESRDLLDMKTQSTSRGILLNKDVPVNNRSSDRILSPEPMKSVRFEMDSPAKNEVVVADNVRFADANDVPSATDNGLTPPPLDHQMIVDQADIPLPKEQSPFADRRPLLPKKRSSFYPGPPGNFEKAMDRGSKTLNAWRVLEEFMDNAVTKSEFENFKKEMLEFCEKKIKASTVEVAKMMDDKIKAQNDIFLKDVRQLFEEFRPNPINMGVRLAAEERVDKYGGQIIVNTTTAETYMIEKLLGEGSFGRVFKVKDSADRECAIKLSLEDPPSDENTDNKKLADTIKAVVKQGEHPPRFLAVPEYFEGFAFGHNRVCERMECYAVDLYGAWMEHKILFSPKQTLMIIGQISSALAFLHKHRFIHADIKPDNIMLANADIADRKFSSRIDARLIDFNGVLKADEQPLEFIGQSVPYRAPEMALEIPCDNKIDVYSLGLVALQVVTGSEDFYVIRDSDVTGFGDTEENAAILGEIERVIGPIPQEMFKQSRNPEFREGGSFKKVVGGVLKKRTMEEVCTTIQRAGIAGCHLAVTARKMLSIDPLKRPSAEEVATRLEKLNQMWSRDPPASTTY